jgi:hypothetical protein
MATKKMLRIEIDNDIDFDRYDKMFTENDKKARIKTGLQLMNNAINGSPAESVVIPILEGTLRGSGSVFLGSTVVGFSPKVRGKGDPADQHREKEGVVTVGFNTAYARRLHEYPFKPGPVSQQSGDVGHKYLTKHLIADKKELMMLYSDFIRKNTK